MVDKVDESFEDLRRAELARQCNAHVDHPRNDIMSVDFNDKYVITTTRDERIIMMPLDWFPWLRDATPEQRADYTLYGSSVEFNQLEEGFSNETMSFGNPHLFKEMSALPEIYDLEDDDESDSDDLTSAAKG